jgi:hypothetical protein
MKNAHPRPIENPIGELKTIGDNTCILAMSWNKDAVSPPESCSANLWIGMFLPESSEAMYFALLRTS